MPEAPALRIQGLRHAYAGQPVLALDSLHLAPGEQCLLLGPSGSGKTTLLHAIAGLLRPDAGKVVIDGRFVTLTPVFDPS